MKTLFASTAIALAMTAPLHAQTATTTTTGNMDSAFVGSLSSQAMRASDLIGARLYVSETDVDAAAGRQQDWNDVGEISDIIVGGGGDIDAVLCDIGGFLGIGERTVAVKMSDLNFVSDGPDSNDYFIVMTGTKEQLDNAPEFDANFERGYNRAGMDPMVGGTGVDTQSGATTQMSGTADTNLAPGTVVADPQTPATAVVTEGGTADTTMNDTAATDTTTGTDAVTSAANSGAAAVGTAAGTVAATASDAGNAVVGGTQQMGSDMGAMMTRPTVARDGYTELAMDDLTTEAVTGASVYDANDKRIGEIGELVMSSDGKLQDAVIDVGGFLGLGEKPVAVSFQSLQILRDEAGSDVRVYVDTTEEQLKALPEYVAN